MPCSKYNLQSERTFETPCILCLLFTGNVPIGRIYISMRADYKQMLGTLTICSFLNLTMKRPKLKLLFLSRLYSRTKSTSSTHSVSLRMGMKQRHLNIQHGQCFLLHGNFKLHISFQLFVQLLSLP